ncbi:cysteine desulfurase family protein [Mahella australiensis]|uniref:Cysteine desulfurase n=1 Tax=Mahella australiensis (strain DSM 15567 / CIP 107919 / 50-1 BON) TaxID=697281 RepID=F4A042_MAHA5|nr:cysteine desulfurase family protein [Mahella australiensis]AEE96876.1 Cysteine desulfurase [Mahella australiensis 50-1 BON]
MPKEVYLDNSATTVVLPRAIQDMEECFLCSYGNPSSLHQKGIEAERILKHARHIIADSIGADDKSIIFTGSGTEANNLAIQGVAHTYARFGKHLITTSIEHPSVLNTFKALEDEGFSVSYIGADRYGNIDIDEMNATIRCDTVLVSVMYVNNEVGSILPVQDIGSLLNRSDHRIIFHVDAVQAYGKLSLKPLMPFADLMTVSAHKIHGPKGIAALYIREGTRIKPLIYGGGQERDIRSGTENVPGAAGFAAAVEALSDKSFVYLLSLKQMLAKGILEAVPNASINGPDVDKGAPHILNISFNGVRGEVLVHALEQEGIYVSTGSACSSRKQKVSHVLKAMGLPTASCESAIRFSLSTLNTQDDIEYTINAVRQIVPSLMRFSRR